MNVSNNLNTMINLESKLDQNAKNIATMGTTNQKEIQQNQQVEDLDLVDAMVEQIEIPIAYSAQGEVIKTKNDTQKTLLEIFA